MLASASFFNVDGTVNDQHPDIVKMLEIAKGFNYKGGAGSGRYPAGSGGDESSTRVSNGKIAIGSPEHAAAVDKIQEQVPLSDRAAFLTEYPDETFAQSDVYLQQGGLAGCALARADDPDGNFKAGEIYNLYNNGTPGGGKDCFKQAMADGGDKVFCFDTLEGYYKKDDFQATERSPWDESQKPANWNEKDNKPGVVWMQRLWNQAAASPPQTK